MLLRRILFAAIVAAPLAWSPAPVSAQERGLRQAETSTAQAVAAGLTNNHAQNRPTEVPKGISKAFGADATAFGADATLPPGISLRFPAPTPDVDEYVDEEECEGWHLDGWVVVDCDGNPVF